MADDGGDSGIPWYSWLILVFHLLVSGGIFWFMHSLVVPSWMAWGISGLWVLLALILGLIDFVLRKGSSDTDSTAFDRWTFVHLGAGVVFGIWYVPILWVVILAFFWECFEFSVAGFGDQEVIANRLVDIGAAIVGWIVVVVLIIAFAKTPFPFAMPVSSPDMRQKAPIQSTHQPQHKEAPRPKPAGR